MYEKTIVLTGHSLLTDGIVSKLAHSGKFDVIDMCQVDPLKLILNAMPSVLVVDQDDPEFCEKLKDKILEVLPVVKIIFLNPEMPKFRIVQSVERRMMCLDDLLNEMDVAIELPINLQQSTRSDEYPVVASLIP